MSGFSSVENGKKGGRPMNEKCKNERYKLDNVNNFVILTENQYNTLIEKYGLSLISKAFLIFDDWLSNSRIGIKYTGKNHYAYFRSDGWLINAAKIQLCGLEKVSSVQRGKC